MYTQEGLARDSTYEGWVAWVGGQAVCAPDGTLLGYDGTTPLFEAVPHNPLMAQVAGGLQDRAPQGGDRQSVDWKDVPQERVVMLELYAFREERRGGGGRFDCGQPVISILKQPGRDLRWIQFKRGGVLVPTTVGPDSEPIGQQRTGITAWVMGYWDRSVGHAEMWEVPRVGAWPPKLELQGANHPCWPRPWGFGLSPHVLGLMPEEVPTAPLLNQLVAGRA